MERYKSIEVLEEIFGLPTKAKVTYEDGTSKEMSGEELDVTLYNFAIQEDYEKSYNFMKNSDKFIQKKKETVVEKTETVEEEKEEKPVTPVVVEVSEDKKDKKGKKDEKTKKKSPLRIFTGIVSLVLLISGGTVAGYVWGNYNRSRDNSNDKPKKQYIEMVDYPEDEKNGLTNRLEVMDARDEEIREELIGVVDGKTQSTEQLDEFLSNQEALAMSNTHNISEFINGKTLTGDIYYADFKSIYNEDTIDYVAVQYFNELRNNIIYAAYEQNNVENTKNAITAFNEMFVRFVFGNKEFNYSETNAKYNWDSLSPSAQNTILAMGMYILTIEHDFSVTIDGEIYNRLFTSEEAYKLKQHVYENILVSQNFYKKNSK